MMGDLAKEMQSQLDFVVRRFQEMTTQVADLNKEFKNSSYVIQSYSETLSTLNNFQVNLKSSLEDLKSKTLQGFEISNSQIANHTSAFISVGVKLVKFEKDISDLKNFISSTESKFSSIILKLDSMSPKSDIVDIKKDVKTMFDAFSLDIKNLQNHIVSETNERKTISNNLSEVKSLLDSGNKDIKNIISNSFNLQSQFNQTKERNSSDLENLKSFLMNHISSSISAIPKPVIPSLDEAQKKLDLKLEPVTLDAQNAKLRSANNESKITLLEKKVENLQLLLNKLQLQGQT